MVWLIAAFADLSVSCIAKKYLKPGKIQKCYYPKNNATAKIKAAVDVDKKSGEWLILPCRILMNGEEFATYSLARKAEKIAQNHSTMSSFQRSFSAKQKARKRPVVHFNSSSLSSSEDESQDFKNIKKLSKVDAGLAVDVDKAYNYNSRPDKNNDDGSLVCGDNEALGSVDNRSLAGDSDDNRSSVDDGNRSSVGDGNRSSVGDGNRSTVEVDDGNRSLGSDDNRSEAIDDNRSLVNGGNRSWAVDDNLSMDQDDKEDNNGSNIDESECDDDFASDNDSSSGVDDNSLIKEPENNCPKGNDSKLFNEIRRDYTDNFQPESTNREQSIVNISSGYNDFSDARRLPFIEKGVFCACQQLEENKAVLKEIKEISFETKVLIQSLMPIIKDLTVEVFDSKEEIKKRNGMFTDLLTPDVQLSIEGIKQYDDVIAALDKHKNVDNMIKYLGSTINESKEKSFIKTCLGVVFQKKFFMKKVWWKNKPGKVNIKNSQILHCIRESFKTKFGLVEPKKSDKEIDKLIYNVSRNMKDSYRKTKKVKKEEKAENARKALEEDVKVKLSKKKAKKQAKEVKVVKEAEQNLTTKVAEKTEEASEDAKKIKKASKEKTKEQNEVGKNLEPEKDEEVQRNIEKKARKAAKKAAKLKAAAINEDAVFTETSERGGTNEGGDGEEVDANEIIQKTRKKASKKAAKFQQCEETTEEAEINGKKRSAGRDNEAEHVKKAKTTEKVKHGKKGE